MTPTVGAVASPSAGALEELDGTPVLPRRARARSDPWLGAARAALVLTATRPRLWALALAAFLARGGVVLLAAPIVVLPTFIGISNIVGPTSVTAAGPSPRLVALVAMTAAIVVLVAIGGTLLGAAAETALVRAIAAPEGGLPAPERARAPGAVAPGTAPARFRRAMARVAVLRLVLLVPVVAAIAVAVPPWVVSAYRELTLPSDVAVPLVVRVLAGAPGATGLVVVAWLAAEVVGGFAARRVVLLGANVGRALAAGAADPLRAPGGTILTLLAALVPSVVALAPAAWGVAASWEVARRALVDDAGAATAIGSSLLLAAAWLGALVLAGILGAWRGTLMTAELLRRHPARHGVPDLRVG